MFAASSLQDAVGEISADFGAATGAEVTLVFAASSTIARQVAEGAPADVVLLADEAWADWLVEQGALAGVAPFAANRLVLVSAEPVPLTDAAGIPAALGADFLALALVDTVPAGRYAKAALEDLGLWQPLEPQVVQAANVRAALRFVQTGEALMGIGYTSDLVALPELYALYEFGLDAAPVAVYSGGAVTARGDDFMDFLQEDAGQSVLRNWGFLPPSGL